MRTGPRVAVRRWGATALVGVAAWTPFAAGCASPTEELHSVRGRVFVDGEPLSSGTVRFVPEQGRPATGDIGPDGSFRLAMFRVGDATATEGVPAGQYRISVSSRDVIDEDGDQVDWHAPRRYANFRTSGLEVDIAGPREDLRVELTWDDEDARPTPAPSGRTPDAEASSASASGESGDVE
ncbi:MAG TPA: hypothetical protein PKC18_09880 [Lacipirellulaceae bacterium]|nr:hypothetical protein [Lacipirellulaceae bacterium]